MKLGIKRLSDLVRLPKYQTLGSSGFDLHALDNYVIMPGETALIETGLAFNIPDGHEIQIRPRSGLSAKSKLRIVLGTIDSDSGQVKVIAENTGHLVIIIDRDDRIAQAVLAPVVRAEFVEEELEDSERSVNGFGHTGK
jgi:dUTP pyrophosphatase